MELPERLLKTIRKQEFIKPGDRVAAAVSGGADSVALVLLLLELRLDLGIVLSVAHVNHKLRGEESDEHRCGKRRDQQDATPTDPLKRHGVDGARSRTPRRRPRPRSMRRR